MSDPSDPVPGRVCECRPAATECDGSFSGKRFLQAHPASLSWSLAACPPPGGLSIPATVDLRGSTTPSRNITPRRSPSSSPRRSSTCTCALCMHQRLQCRPATAAVIAVEPARHHSKAYPAGEHGSELSAGGNPLSPQNTARTHMLFCRGQCGPCQPPPSLPLSDNSTPNPRGQYACASYSVAGTFQCPSLPRRLSTLSPSIFLTCLSLAILLAFLFRGLPCLRSPRAFRGRS